MATTRVLTTAEVPSELLVDIRRLLDESFAGHFSEDDWEHGLGGWHAIVTDGGAVVAHAAVVARTLHVAERPVRAGYVENVGAAPARERQGLATLAMTEINDVLRREFDMGALSTGAHPFYERLGWERWQGPTFVRSGAELIRTEDEDDGLMVLRFGPSADVDLTESLTCTDRPGEAW